MADLYSSLGEKMSRRTKTRIDRIGLNYQNLQKKMHKIYLSLALFLGCIMVAAFPLFQEPDGTYHFEDSASLVGLTTDLSNSGYVGVTSGTGSQAQFYQSRTFFRQYFKTEAKIIPESQVPRNLGAKTELYDFIGHLVPAGGLWLGYHIYPSLGMMTVFGRLISLLVYAFFTCLTIKWLKRGKLLFSAVMLSPVILTQYTSFSYDGFSNMFVAASLAFAVNMIVNKKITWKTILGLIFFSTGLILAVKSNFAALILLYFIIFIVNFVKGWRDQNKIKLFMKFYKPLIIGFVILGGILATLYLSKYGGIIDVLYRFFITSVYSFGEPLTISSFVSADLYMSRNFTEWLTVIWFILIFLCAMVEEKYVDSRLISNIALFSIFFNIAAVSVKYIGYMEPGYSPAPVVHGGLRGAQGRYFTVLWPLLGIYIGNTNSKLKLKGYEIVVLLMILVVVLTNSINIFVNLYSVIWK